MKFDNQEKAIVKELVKDPKISDNQIAIKTNIPVKSVNRKRKKLEKANVLNYYVSVNNGVNGTGVFGSKKMYIISFKYGISREMFLDAFPNMQLENVNKHIDQVMSSEIDGRFAIIIMIESRVENDIIEIFNVEIVNKINTRFGECAIHKTQVFPIDSFLRVHHNYMPNSNIKEGKIKKDWDDENIFVG